MLIRDNKNIEADTARCHYAGPDLVTPCLPSSVADNFAHVAKWNIFDAWRGAGKIPSSLWQYAGRPPGADDPSESEIETAERLPDPGRRAGEILNIANRMFQDSMRRHGSRGIYGITDLLYSACRSVEQVHDPTQRVALLTEMLAVIRRLIREESRHPLLFVAEERAALVAKMIAQVPPGHDPLRSALGEQALVAAEKMGPSGLQLDMLRWVAEAMVNTGHVPYLKEVLHLALVAVSSGATNQEDNNRAMQWIPQCLARARLDDHTKLSLFLIAMVAAETICGPEQFAIRRQIALQLVQARLRHLPRGTINYIVLQMNRQLPASDAMTIAVALYAMAHGLEEVAAYSEEADGFYEDALFAAKRIPNLQERAAVIQLITSRGTQAPIQCPAR